MSDKTPQIFRARGFVLPLFILLFVVFIGMVAFAVDIGYVTVSKSELRSAVDAANLAGASGLGVSPAEVRTRAKNIAASNKVGGKPLVLQDSDIELGTWDSTTKTFTLLTGSDESKATAIRITAQLSKARGTALNLTFASMIGTKSVDLSVRAVAGFTPAADVVIIQDITSSFAEEIDDAKVADQALLDALNSTGGGRSSVGYVVHTGWGKTLSPIVKLSVGYSDLTKAISSTLLCGGKNMPVCSGTDIASGLEEATKLYDDSSYLSFANSNKAIVLVSDGEPTANSAGSHPSLSATQLLSLAQQDADTAWSKSIHVYVVFFNRDNDATAADRLKTLIRGKGVFVQVTDAKKLPEALVNLTKNLPMALLQ